MTWILFDWAGTVAFAVSGAMVGLSRRMDIFGVIVLALLTAVGGGMVRDVLAGITPPGAMTKTTDLLMSIVAAILVSFAYSAMHFDSRRRKSMTFLYNLSDTIGLASFTVTGASTGLMQGTGDPYVFPVTLGVITAVGGGMLRDLMAQRVPVVLRMDVYAVASLAGGIVMCWSWPIWGTEISSWICFLVVLLLRGCALHFGWQLYHPHPGGRMFHRRAKHQNKDL
ncbi:trimeric intracellular cation channel family protein [Mitsuokella sp. AF21-1AC]|uniref:trimeric intracellular cation channel family protein n=1 Tax=Mitsuokella sp. AF21-1AC TaxID=2292235 RepID=UPI001F3FAB3B|nr:trimeric intracellular cation channel family protein [Mitsuokella sp. AF21-1AC]